MFRNLFLTGTFLLFGFLVLVVSILRSASLRHSFNLGDYRGANIGFAKSVDEVGYFFVYPGKVLPGDLLWGIKAARDKFWLFLTPGATRKAELNLLFSDKRLMGFVALLEKGRFDDAFNAMIRSESYFKEASRLEEEARKSGSNTNELLILLVKASFAHWKVLRETSEFLPSEFRSEVEKSANFYSNFYRVKLNYLKSINLDTSSLPQL